MLFGASCLVGVVDARVVVVVMLVVAVEVVREGGRTRETDGRRREFRQAVPTESILGENIFS